MGAERAGNDGATNQTRGETLKHKDGMETKGDGKWPLKNQHVNPDLMHKVRCLTPELKAKIEGEKG